IGSETIHGVRNSLAILVQRTRRWIKGSLPGKNIPVLVAWTIAKLDNMTFSILGHSDQAMPEAYRCAIAAANHSHYGTPQFGACQLRSFARYYRLPRSRRFPSIWRNR